MNFWFAIGSNCYEEGVVFADGGEEFDMEEIVFLVGFAVRGGIETIEERYRADGTGQFAAFAAEELVLLLALLMVASDLLGES